MRSIDTPSDEQLVEAIRADHLEEWDELVRRHYEPLLRYLTTQIRDPDDAADLTQDAFLAAAEHIHAFQFDRPFAAWLYRIAQNRVRRMWRRQHQQRIVSLDWLREDSLTLEMRLWEPTDMEVSVVEQHLVKHALEAIRPALRTALFLNVHAGLSASQLADVLQITAPAAERRLSRAKQQFRAAYSKLSDPR